MIFLHRCAATMSRLLPSNGKTLTRSSNWRALLWDVVSVQLTSKHVPMGVWYHATGNFSVTLLSALQCHNKALQQPQYQSAGMNARTTGRHALMASLWDEIHLTIVLSSHVHAIETHLCAPAVAWKSDVMVLMTASSTRALKTGIVS